MQCDICCDTYTAHLRKPVQCPYCDYKACAICVKKYLVDGVLDAHCMSCRRAWNDDFLDITFTKAFRTGAYKKHREDILIDREIAILPTRQGRVEATLYLREAQEIWRGFQKELEAVELMRLKIHGKSRGVQAKITRYTAESEGRAPPAWTLTEGEKAATPDKAKFIMKCPDSECRGFLSTAYKCGTCQKWSCADCLVVKGTEKDTPHTCDPGQKESVALIIKESKPCPKCGERISKIDGCFAADTPVLLWNGKIKMSQDITVGDSLVGDDGSIRTVQSTCTGEDDMYEVTQNRGITYTVNSKHTLVLKQKLSVTNTNLEKKGWRVNWVDPVTITNKTKSFLITDTIDEEATIKLRDNYIQLLNLPDSIEILVEDYVKLSDAVKKNLLGYKASGINWPKKDVILDPYMMGLWLGDGICNGLEFACCPEKDPEIITYLLDWCNINGCELVHDDTYRFRVRRSGASLGRDAIGHGAKSSTCKGCSKKKCNLCDMPNSNSIHTESVDKHPLKAAIEYYGLIRNKHIPEDYLTNDRASRLQLLAGFIDTDGYLGNEGKRIQIPQANHAMAKQIELLASSLGFIVSIDTVHKKNISFNGEEKKDYPDQLRVNISGENLSDIPTRVLRKKCVNSSPNKDWLVTSISISSIGRGKYYGWSIDKNHRFLLKDTTVQRNCDQMWCVDCHTAFSWATGNLVNGVVHNPHYYEYLRKEGNGVAPRNAGDIPCGGVPYYAHIQRAISKLPGPTQRLIMNIHRITSEIADQRIQAYQAAFNVNDNGDLAVKYLMKEIDKDTMKVELGKREVKRNKHLAIRAVLEMFVTTSTMILNNIVSTQDDLIPMTPEQVIQHFEPTITEFRNLRTYVNDSLLHVSRMKNCSVPQIANDWRWNAFNKVAPKARAAGAVAPAVPAGSTVAAVPAAATVAAVPAAADPFTGS